MTEQSHAITVSHPPAAILRVANPILRFLLRTPVMGAARKQLMVVSFNGRKTGRQYTIPLSAHRIDNDLYALTPAPWQRNFRDGAAAGLPRREDDDHARRTHPRPFGRRRSLPTLLRVLWRQGRTADDRTEIPRSADTRTRRVHRGDRTRPPGRYPVDSRRVAVGARPAGQFTTGAVDQSWSRSPSTRLTNLA